jgi:Helix-turn-helix domain
VGTLFTPSSILFGVLGSIAAAEIYAYLPKLARVLVRRAAGRIEDRNVRERVAEEWQATIHDMPGHLMQVRHAVSLFFAASRVEHEWRPELDDPEFIEHVGDIERAIRALGEKIRQARVRGGVELDALSRETCISVAWLRALENGRVGALPQGAYIRGWLGHISNLLRADGQDFRFEFDQIIAHEGLLAPRRPGGRMRSRRCWVHRYETWKVHSDAESVFHWEFAECVECGYATLMYPEVCDCSGEPTLRHNLAMQSGTTCVSPSFSPVWRGQSGVLVGAAEYRAWRAEYRPWRLNDHHQSTADRGER